MNKEFIWFFNTSALSDPNGAFSLEYHVVKSKLKVEPGLLAGSKLWLVLRHNGENYLFGVVTPSIIEQYQEGPYKDDFLLTGEPFLSVRTLPRLESKDSWILPLVNGDDEIRECTDTEHDIILQVITANRRVSFAQPSKKITESIPSTIFQDLEQAVPNTLATVLRKLAFGDIARVHSLPNSISAFGCVALTLLKSSHPHLSEADIVSLLSKLDPSLDLQADPLEKQAKLVETLSNLPPVVDLILEEIDPDKISPRTFIASSKAYSSEWINKTNDAEAEHEKILKDVVLYLKNKGYKVYKTRSFDIFSEKSNSKQLWEIKSANQENSVPQGEKGIIQLLRYSTAISNKDWGDVTFSLLLQDTKQKSIQQYIAQMCNNAGIVACFYDEQKVWPERVFDSNDKSLLL